MISLELSLSLREQQLLGFWGVLALMGNTLIAGVQAWVCCPAGSSREKLLWDLCQKRGFVPKPGIWVKGASGASLHPKGLTLSILLPLV